VAAEAGADFLVFDMEHTGWSVETIRTLAAGCRPTDTAPFARVPASEYHFLARCMDAGVMGVMVPMVESAEQAAQIVSAVTYPPGGRRGAAFGIAHDDYRPGDVIEKMRSANDEKLVICQVETVAGLRNVDAMAAVDGVDVIWVGHFDLTNSMGIPGRFDHPDYLAALDTVATACKRHNKAAGFMASTPEEARSMIERGYRAIAYWGDLWLYQRALREGISAIRPSGGS
jgi:2-dehydro-3-deoxyglucarate aldolase/4-hydroxy-2-oxoheptanedioate aldolase